eukprot:jgi/Botrbrau1/3465/Bobra.139_1s0040.1
MSMQWLQMFWQRSKIRCDVLINEFLTCTIFAGVLSHKLGAVLHPKQAVTVGSTSLLGFFYMCPINDIPQNIRVIEDAIGIFFEIAAEDLGEHLGFQGFILPTRNRCPCPEPSPDSPLLRCCHPGHRVLHRLHPRHQYQMHGRLRHGQLRDRESLLVAGAVSQHRIRSCYTPGF